MQFMFTGRPNEEVAASLPDNFMELAAGDGAKAREYYAQGVFRSLWRAGSGVIGLCEAGSRQQLDSLLAELPLAKAGYVDLQVYELGLFIGFAPEFG